MTLEPTTVDACHSSTSRILINGDALAQACTDQRSFWTAKNGRTPTRMMPNGQGMSTVGSGAKNQGKFSRKFKLLTEYSNQNGDCILPPASAPSRSVMDTTHTRPSRHCFS